MKNVLFISIDDLINVVRYRHAYGTPFQTPNIDRLLDMGTYFNGAHALVAECNPSRASVLTGQSLFRTGVEDNNQRFFDLVDPRTTLPYLFREAGYETAAVGKLFHRWVESGDQRGGLIGFMNELFDVHRLTRGDTDRGGEGGGILAGIGPTRRPESQLADHKAVTWASDTSARSQTVTRGFSQSACSNPTWSGTFRSVTTTSTTRRGLRRRPAPTGTPMRCRSSFSSSSGASGIRGPRGRQLGGGDPRLYGRRQLRRRPDRDAARRHG